VIAVLHSAWASAAIAFTVTLALTPAVRAFCIRLELFDAPGPLKIHPEPVPRLGGAAIFIGIFAAAILNAHPRERSTKFFLASLALVWLAGFVDDLRNLSPAIRVGAQFIAGALIWQGGWRVSIFGSTVLGFLGVCVAVPAMANATNLFDGLDGLAGGTVAIIASAYLILPRAALSPLGCVVAAGVLGACLGFLPANLPPRAKIFMGDGGSTLLGFTIAFLAVDFLAIAPTSPPAIAFPLLVAAVPLLDAALAAIRRVRSRTSALRGDRSHVYDLIRARGFSVPATLMLLYGVTAALSAIAVLLIHKSSETIAAAVVTFLGVLVIAAIRLGSLKNESVPRTRFRIFGRAL